MCVCWLHVHHTNLSRGLPIDGNFTVCGIDILDNGAYDP